MQSGYNSVSDGKKVLPTALPAVNQTVNDRLHYWWENNF